MRLTCGLGCQTLGRVGREESERGSHGYILLPAKLTWKYLAMTGEQGGGGYSLFAGHHREYRGCKHFS